MCARLRRDRTPEEKLSPWKKGKLCSSFSFSSNSICIMSVVDTGWRKAEEDFAEAVVIIASIVELLLVVGWGSQVPRPPAKEMKKLSLPPSFRRRRRDLIPKVSLSPERYDDAGRAQGEKAEERFLGAFLPAGGGNDTFAFFKGKNVGRAQTLKG